MPRGSGKSRQGEAGGIAGPDSAFQRIANLLALLLVKGESETDKVVSLTAVGYSAAEIGQLLGKRPNTVSAILYKAKRDEGRRTRS